MSYELPSWAPTLRPHQSSAIQDIVASFDSGSNVVMFDAPTGSGKTLIAEIVRQQLNVRALYLCSSLALQQQFVTDLPYAARLMGRSNYETHDDPSQFPDLTAAECTKIKSELPACPNCTESSAEEVPHCQWCHPVGNCPYERAKALAMRSDLVCTNSYYFLFEANFVGNLPIRRGLIIIDEADTLEDILLSFVSVHISERQSYEYGIQPPEKKTVESSWVQWAIDAEQRVAKLIANTHGQGLSEIKRRNRLGNLATNLKRLNDPSTGLQSGGWVYTGYDRGDISFKPIRVDNLAREFVWRHCKRFLIMSATTISFAEMAESLGLN